MLGELTSAEADTVLRDGVIGRIGCLSAGRPYVVPICYAYEEGDVHGRGDVYGHSVDGMKLRALRDSPLVCFEVEAVEDLSNWRSVIAWGTAEELHGTPAEQGMRLLVERVLPLLAPGSTSAHPTPSGTPVHAAVFRIRLRDVTGRFETQTG